MKPIGVNLKTLGGGFLRFNATLDLKLYPLEIVALPFWTYCDDPDLMAGGWRFTFRWLIFFATIFYKRP